MTEFYTAQDLMVQALQGILSYAAPDLAASPLSGWLSSLITSPTMRMLGVNDPLTPILATNATTTGIFNLRTSSRINQMSSTFSSQLSHNILEQRLRDLEMTRLGRFEQWNANNGNNRTVEEYNSLIDSEVAAWFRRPGFEGMYNMANQAFGFDPTSLSASRYMGLAAQNVLSRGIYTGGRRYAGLGIGTLERLFTGTDGRPERFDRGAWNGFDQGSVASIAELVTRETDILNGIGTEGDIAAKAREAGESFRKKVRDLTAALAPLRDVFGDDLNKMVQTIEDLTGQSVGSMSTGRLRSLSENITNRVNSGLYNPTEMQAFNMQMTARLSEMPGLNPYNYMSATSQSLRVLDMLKGAQQPDSMTNRQWQRAAMGFVSDTSNAGAADLYARAYSVWAHNRKAGEDTSTAAFNARVQELGGGRGAWVKAAGLTFAAEADEGLGYSFYRQAVESGAAGNASGYAMLDRLIAVKADRIGLNENFMRAVDVNSSAEASKVFMDVVGAVEENTGLRVMSEEDRMRYLMNVRNMSLEDARRINTGLNYLEARRDTKHILNLASFRSGERKMAAANARAAERSKRLEGIQSQLLNTKGGIIVQLLDNGFSLSALKKRLEEGGLIDRAGEDPDSILAITGAGASGASEWYANDKAGGNAFAAALFNYAMSGEAMANESFNKAMDEYAAISRKDLDTLSDEDRTALRRNRDIMVGFMDLGTDKMNEFLNSSPRKGKIGDNKEANIDKLDSILKEARGSGVKVRTRDAVDMVIAEHRIAQLNDSKASEIMADFKARGWADINGDKIKGSFEGFSKYYEEAKKGAGEDTMKSLEAVKGVVQGLGGMASPGLESILTGLNDTLNKLVDVLGGRSKDKVVVESKNSRTIPDPRTQIIGR